MVILQLLASYGVLYRYGKHIVEDRSNQIRLQLFLNGIKTWKYWAITIVYCIVVAICLQIFIAVVGMYIF